MKLFARLKTQNKFLLFVAAFIVILWGYYNTLYFAKLKDVRAISKDAANLETIIKTMKESGVTTVDSSVDKFRLKLRDREFSKMAQRLNLEEKRLLKRENISEYLSSLTSLYSQYKIEVAYFAPHPDKEIDSGTAYKGIPLELNIHTTWKDLVVFLEAVENLPTLAILRDIELEADKEKLPCVNGKLILELWLKD